MSARRIGRTRPYEPADARARLRQAQLYLEVAILVASDEPSEQATVAIANAVLAGIALLRSLSVLARRADRWLALRVWPALSFVESAETTTADASVW